MKKIPVKNYFILILILIIVVAVTFLVADLYKKNKQKENSFYTEMKSIGHKELNLYLKENPTTIIYIADKYSNENEETEKKLKNIIIETNLYDNFVYLDKTELSNYFLENFEKEYDTKIDKKKLPIIIIVNDRKVEAIYNSVNDSVINLIDFEGLKWFI